MSSRSSSSSSSSTTSSSSSSARSRLAASSVESEYYTTYLKIPKKQSKSVKFMAWAAGAPRNSSVVKKVTRETSERQSPGIAPFRRGHVPDSDTQLFWVTGTPDQSNRSEGSSSRPGPHIYGGNPRPAMPGVQHVPPRTRPPGVPPGVVPGAGGIPAPGMGAPGAGRGAPMMNAPGGIPAFHGAATGGAPVAGIPPLVPGAGAVPPPR